MKIAIIDENMCFYNIPASAVGCPTTCATMMGWSEITSHGTVVIGIDNGGDVDGVIL